MRPGSAAALAIRHDVDRQEPNLTELAQLLRQLLDRTSYSETDVLTLDEFCAAVKIGKTKLFEILPGLPVSYALGKASPRIIWGDALKHIRDGYLQ